MTTLTVNKEYSKKELREMELPELKALAKKFKVKVKGKDKDDLVRELALETFRVDPLPRGRVESVRGFVFSTLFDKSGNPVEVEMEDLVNDVSRTFGLDKPEAETMVKEYIWELRRYYGVDRVDNDNGLISFSTRRRDTRPGQVK